jgi:hypothetical protein
VRIVTQETYGEEGVFVNLRAKPTVRSKIIQKLESGEILYVDTDETVQLFKGWTHIQDVEMQEPGSRNYPITGWISNKYIKPTTCPGYEAKPARKEETSPLEFNSPLPPLPPEQVR